MNDIIKFLNFEDDDLETDPPYVKNGKRFITIRKKLKAHCCPICSYRMYSKGIYERTVNHPIVQDGLPLVLKVQQRRWRCNNPACGHTMNDEFIFLEARKQNTKMTHDRKVHEEREQDFHRRLSFPIQENTRSLSISHGSSLIRRISTTQRNPFGTIV